MQDPITRFAASVRRWGALRWASMVVLVWAVLAAAPTVAQRISVPIAVRITGYVNQKPTDVPTQFEWVVAQERTEVRLYIKKLVVKTGQVSPGNIDDAVNPYHVSFQLAGEKPALQALTTAAAGTPVTIDAYLQFGEGARIMMIETVKAEAAPTVPAKPADP